MRDPVSLLCGLAVDMKMGKPGILSMQWLLHCNSPPSTTMTVIITHTQKDCHVPDTFLSTLHIVTQSSQESFEVGPVTIPTLET